MREKSRKMDQKRHEDGERCVERKGEGGGGWGAGIGMTCMNSKASRGKGGFAIHFEACSTSVCLT